MADIIIKQGKLSLTVDRNELVQIDETPDGIVFQFKNGLSVMKIDQYMPSSVKQLMKNASDNYPGKKLIYELDNPRRPVCVDAT